MKVQIGLVTIRPYYRGHLRLFGRRKSIPVYLPSHRDPEISAEAAQEHFHIAWNRITMRTSRGERRAKTAVWAYQVESVRIPKTPLPIITPPCVMHRCHFPEIDAIKKRLEQSHNGYRHDPKT
jgi:hypothetical protein